MPITLVQSNNIASGGWTATSSSLAFSSNNTAGNTLVAFAWGFGGSGTMTISDTEGNAWTALANLTSYNFNQFAWVAYNCKAGANTVTVTGGTYSLFFAGPIAEISGVNALDQLVTGNDAGTGADSSPNLTTTKASSIICLGYQSGGINNPGLPGGSPLTQWGANTPGYEIAGSVVESSTGTYSFMINPGADNPSEAGGFIVFNLYQMSTSIAITEMPDMTPGTCVMFKDL